MNRFLKKLSVIAIPAVLLAAAVWPPQDHAASHAEPADPEIGAPAPNFILPGSDGETYTLSELEGSYVVLEWLNFGCPYVRRHYESGNMPALQQTYTEKGVTWLSIVSSAPGKQGYYPPDQMKARNEEMGGKMTAILLDPEGEVGRLYGAIVTPHMFVIGPDGTLLYKGGIDDRPRASRSETTSVPSYVSMALDAAMSGEEIAVTTSPPYGCEVKYR